MVLLCGTCILPSLCYGLEPASGGNAWHGNGHKIYIISTEYI